MKRSTLIKQVGFTKKVTGEVIAALEGKTTKAAASVSDRMKRVEYYEVFASEDRFTVNSRFIVTVQEQKQIAAVLGLEYISVGDVMEENDLWTTWTRCDNDAEDEEVEAAEEAQQEQQPQEAAAEPAAGFYDDLSNDELVEKLEDVLFNIDKHGPHGWNFVTGLKKEIKRRMGGPETAVKRRIVRTVPDHKGMSHFFKKQAAAASYKRWPGLLIEQDLQTGVFHIKTTNTGGVYNGAQTKSNDLI